MPSRGERVVERRDTAARPAVLQGEPVVGLDEVDADPAVVPAVHEVERLVRHARTLDDRYPVIRTHDAGTEV